MPARRGRRVESPGAGAGAEARARRRWPGVGAIVLPGSPEFSPDLGGWRRERLPRLPDGRIALAPDWICEILSPGIRGYDQRIKRPYDARIGVGRLWYVDLEAHTLTVSRLEGGHGLEVLVAGEDDRVRAEPFAAVESELGDWWGGPATDEGRVAEGSPAELAAGASAAG